MTHHDVDAWNAYYEAIHKKELDRWVNGQCHCCGADFLIGREAAEVLDGTRTIYLCFWCFDAMNDDPTDPQPSRFHYGTC